jgi:hypothetical protein
MLRLTTYVTSSPTRRRGAGRRRAGQRVQRRARRRQQGQGPRASVSSAAGSSAASAARPHVGRRAAAGGGRGLAHLVPVAVDLVEVAAAVAGAALGVDRGVQVGAADRRPAAVGLLPGQPDRAGRPRAGQAGLRVGQRGDVRAAAAGRATARRADVLGVDRSAARAARSRPRRDRAASSSICGQGRSGLTWSGVSGETPPQSSMPARSSSAYSASTRFGGAWMRAAGPAPAGRPRSWRPARRSSASGMPRIAVSGLARKFWTMTSWMWPYSRASRRIAKSESARSASVSPMPIRMPVVNGTDPAGVLEHPQPDGRLLVGRAVVRAARLDHSRRDVVSSIMPMLGATGLSRCSPPSSARRG